MSYTRASYECETRGEFLLANVNYHLVQCKPLGFVALASFRGSCSREHWAPDDDHVLPSGVMETVPSGRVEPEYTCQAALLQPQAEQEVLHQCGSRWP